MTSGYMWNQIRHPQYVQAAQNGKVNYIAGGYSNQLGAETHIVATICECRLEGAAREKQELTLAFSAQTASSLSLPTPWPTLCRGCRTPLSSDWESTCGRASL